MNVILGGGVIGCIAKTLYSNFTLIPFKASRFYTFEHPLANNFINYNDKIDKYIRENIPKSAAPYIVKYPYSFQGGLIFEDIPDLREMFAEKMYGHSDHRVQTLKTSNFIYQMTTLDFYNQLTRRLSSDIKTNSMEYGIPTHIDLNNRTIIFQNSKTITYDKIISTIPLDALFKLCRVQRELNYKSICYYVINSKDVNLEGGSICRVVDKEIDFVIVQKLNEINYLFYTFDKIENPYVYLGGYIGYKFDIVDATRIENAIPIGPVPDLLFLEENGIYCAGSNAQHDDYMDISSCIIRLLGLSVQDNI